MPKVKSSPGNHIILDHTGSYGGYAAQQPSNARREMQKEILSALQNLADRLGHVPTEKEIDQKCRYKVLTVLQYFDNDLRNALSQINGAAESTSVSGSREQLHKIVAGTTSDEQVLRLPPNVVTRSDFREVVLSIAARRGVVPKNHTEEAVTFHWLGVGEEYFKRHPFIQDAEAPSITRLVKIRYLLLGERSQNHRPVLAYHLNEQSYVVGIDLFESETSIPSQWHMDLAGIFPKTCSPQYLLDYMATHADAIERIAKAQGISLVNQGGDPVQLLYFAIIPKGSGTVQPRLLREGVDAVPNQSHLIHLRWSSPQSTYYPKRVSDEMAFKVARAWASARTDVSGDVKEALLRRLLGAEYHGKVEFPILSLKQFISGDGYDPVAEITQVATLFDEGLGIADAVRVSFRVHGPRGKFAQLTVEAWDPRNGLENKNNVAEMIFQRGVPWQLRWYGGVGAAELSDRFVPSVQSEIDAGKVSDVEVGVIRKDHVRLTLAQLHTVLGNPRQRQLLMNTLWIKDHGFEPFPSRYALKSIIAVGKTTQVEMAQGLAVVPLGASEIPNWARDHTMLLFEAKEHGPDRLRYVSGKGSHRLALATLHGDGITVQSGLEEHVALRLLSVPNRHLMISPNLTSSDVLDYMKAYGAAAPWRLASLAHAIVPEFPERPNVLALSGIETNEKVGAVKLWHGAINRRDVEAIYFWVQWEIEKDGSVNTSLVSRNFGQRIVDAILHSKSEVFVPSDEAICKPEPLTTPAELQKVEPRNVLEEIVAHGEAQDRYLKRNPTSIDDVASVFRLQGPEVVTRLWQIQRLSQNAHHLSKQPTQLALHLELNYTGFVKKIYLMDKNGAGDGRTQTVDLDFVWHPDRREYVPQKSTRAFAMRISDAILQHRDINLESMSVRNLVDYALGYPRRGVADLESLIALFREHGADAINQLILPAQMLNPMFGQSVAWIRMLLHIATPETFSSLRIEPFDPATPWKSSHDDAQYLFERTAQGWQLRQFGGQYSSIIEAVIPKGLAIGGLGNVPISWEELKDVMTSPERRRVLFETLWQRDHRGERLPQRFVFQFGKDGDDETRTPRMKIFSMNEASSMTRSNYYGWLWFEPSDNAGSRLSAIEGRNSGEVAEWVLMGDGVVLDGPVERVLVLRLLSDGKIISGASGSISVSLTDIVTYFVKYGAGVVDRLLYVARVAQPKFGEFSDTFAVTGLQRSNPITAIDGLSVQSDTAGVIAPSDRRYFWIQFGGVLSEQRSVIRTQRYVGELLSRIFQENGSGDYGAVLAGSGGHALQLKIAALAKQGIDASHPVEQALVANILHLKIKGPGGVRSSWQEFQSYFSSDASAAIAKLLHIQKALDPSWDMQATEIHLYVRTKPTDDNYSGLMITNQDNPAGSHVAHVVLTPGESGQWTAVRHMGMTSREIAQWFDQKATSGGQVFAPDADEMEKQAADLRPKPEVLVPSDEAICKPEPLTTPAELKKVEPMITLPVDLKQGVPGFVPTTLTSKELATPPSILIPVLSGEGYDGEVVDLPDFIGQDIFLDEPPARVVMMGGALILGGVVIGATAIAVAPTVGAFSVAWPELPALAPALAW